MRHPQNWLISHMLFRCTQTLTTCLTHAIKNKTKIALPMYLLKENHTRVINSCNSTTSVFWQNIHASKREYHRALITSECNLEVFGAHAHTQKPFK